MMCLGILFLAARVPAAPDTLVVRVTGMAKPGGVIDLTVYKNDSHYLRDDSFVVCRRVACDSARVAPAVYVPLVLVPGEYAFVVYHDVNSNGTLDANFLGIPVEPMAFSRPFRVSIRAPRFEEISFKVNRPRDTMEVRLQK
ncbi:MAG TPA: DUF2141 domain-containing protein [Chitinivibrionales bacterium]|jgi:uncharacterized protein (DUF2141 family)|nr:DUF2141 domain-containing protein [Chitinivibrionales bacterium]